MGDILDIVIPYVHSEANELRFALRSIEKFQPESRVVLVGDLPSWYQGTYLHAHRNDLTKQLNVKRKITLAMYGLPNEISLSRHFILWYDDLYQIKSGKVTASHFGTLKEAKKKNLGQWFMANVINTMKIYPDGLYYGNHEPMVIDSELFMPAMRLDWGKDYLVKSLYGNFAKVGGEYRVDCKFRDGNILEFTKDKQFFSTDIIETNTLNLLNEIFPHASRYEKGNSN